MKNQPFINNRIGYIRKMHGNTYVTCNKSTLNIVDINILTTPIKNVNLHLTLKHLCLNPLV